MACFGKRRARHARKRLRKLLRLWPETAEIKSTRAHSVYTPEPRYRPVRLHRRFDGTVSREPSRLTILESWRGTLSTSTTTLNMAARIARRERGRK